jgi:hypothetical protein
MSFGALSSSSSWRAKSNAPLVNSRASHRLALEVDEVVGVHRKRLRRELEPLLDEVLHQHVSEREAHRAELAVHRAGELAMREDAASQAALGLQDRDPVPRLAEHEARRQAGHPGSDDDDVLWSGAGRRQAVLEQVEVVQLRAHAITSLALGVEAAAPPPRDAARKSVHGGTVIWRRHVRASHPCRR